MAKPGPKPKFNETMTETVLVRLTPDHLKALEQWAASNGMGSVPDAFRYLMLKEVQGVEVGFTENMFEAQPVEVSSNAET